MSTRTYHSAPNHIQRLDVLRAVAILLVVLFHFNITLADVAAGRESKILGEIFTFGSSGVPLFFVISGFCIHLSFLKDPRQSVRGFYWRRFCRIYPPYFMSLVVFSLLAAFKIRGSINLKQFLIHALLVHNFFPAANFYAINSAYWSLAVEFQFYLLFPVLLLLRSRFGLPVCLAGAFALTVLYEMACLFHPIIAKTVSNPTVVPDWYGWILGACLVESYVQGKRFWPAGRLLLLPSFALMIYAYLETSLLVFHVFTAYLFFSLLMEVYLNFKGALRVWERLLIPVGTVSYSIYLWHYPVLEMMHKFLRAVLPPALASSELFEFFVCLPLTGAVLAPIVILSYRVGERWAQKRLRDLRPAI
jgi:peptidoglycan/LPS O-acetylase OafA/YrhL